MSIQAHTLAKAATTLQFQDSASCMRWIAALPITNVQMVQQMLSEQVGALAIANRIRAAGYEIAEDGRSYDI